MKTELPDSIEAAIKAGLIQPAAKIEKKKYRKMTTDVVKEMVRLAKEGYSQKDISARLNRRQCSVSHSLKRHGRYVFMTHDEMKNNQKNRKV